MKKLHKVGIVGTVFVILVLAVVSGMTGKAAERQITVGAVLPLTGDIASVGMEIQRGIELAADEVKGNSQIRLVFEDSEFPNPQKAISASYKLINFDKADIVIGSIVEDLKPVASIFESNKVPVIAVWDSNEWTKNAGYYIFSIGFSTEKAGERMADFAIANLSARKAYVIYHIDEWSLIISKSFSDRFSASGGTVLANKGVEIQQEDYRTLIADAKDKDADVIYAPLLPFNSVLFLKQAEELGYSGYILSGDALLDEVISAAGESAEDVYFTNTYAPEGVEFTQMNNLYREKFGEDPVSPTAVAMGYDGLFIAYHAIEISERTNQTIASALYNVEFTGALGETMIEKTGVAEKLERIFTVRNGKPVLVE